MSAERTLLEQTRAAHAAGRILHDPIEQGGPCPECNEPWPCAERKRQRQIIKEMVAYLKSDLYERAPALPDDPPGMRWTSPIGWSVWMTYGHGGVPATIRDPKGRFLCSTTSADVTWLELDLP